MKSISNGNGFSATATGSGNGGEEEQATRPPRPRSNGGKSQTTRKPRSKEAQEKPELFFSWGDYVGCVLTQQLSFRATRICTLCVAASLLWLPDNFCRSQPTTYHSSIHSSETPLCDPSMVAVVCIVVSVGAWSDMVTMTPRDRLRAARRHY